MYTQFVQTEFDISNLKFEKKAINTFIYVYAVYGGKKIGKIIIDFGLGPL